MGSMLESLQIGINQVMSDVRMRADAVGVGCSPRWVPGPPCDPADWSQIAFNLHCFATQPEAAGVKMCAHRLPRAAVDLITARRHDGKTGRWGGKKKAKVERRGRNNEGRLLSAHSQSEER